MKKNDTFKLFKYITDIFVYLMVTIFVLFFSPSGYENILQAKYYIFCVLCGGYVLISLLLLLELALIGQLKFHPVHLIKNMGIPQKAALLYLLFTWVSAIVSPHFPKTLIGVSRYEGAVTTTIYCLSFILVSYFGKAKRGMLWVFSAVVTLFSVLCILQMKGLNPFGLFPEGITFLDAGKMYSGQFVGTIGNADNVAAFLCIAIPIFAFCLIRLKDKKRIMLFIPFSLSLFVLFRIHVLAGLVGVGLGMALAIPFSLKISKKTKTILVLVLIVLMVLGITLIYFIKPTDEGMFFEIHELLHGNFNSDFGSGRLYIWTEIIKKVPDNIFFGTGPDTMLNENIAPFVRYDDELAMSFVAQIDVAHNEYLNILFHQGIFAALSYLVLIVSVLVEYVKQENEASKILGSAVLCYLIQAFFGFSTPAISPMFWVLLSLTISYKNTKENLYE